MVDMVYFKFKKAMKSMRIYSSDGIKTVQNIDLYVLS